MLERFTQKQNLPIYNRTVMGGKFEGVCAYIYIYVRLRVCVCIMRFDNDIYMTTIAIDRRLG